MFTESDVINVARLARLSLSKDEISRFKEDLGRILAFIEQLQEVDVAKVEPMSHAGQLSLTLRGDEALETLGRECLKSSAGYEDGLIRVPKIIE